jgi:2-hydroxy-3-keto-5-methylthiopentenyl-1-phosphate phosphatase
MLAHYGCMDEGLRDIAVFLDFDGTVTTDDTTRHILRRLSAPGWEAITAEYRAGNIGSRTSLKRLWELLPHDLQLLSAVAAEVPIDPCFGQLLDFLARGGAEVAILSDGLGFFAEQTVAGRVPVITNQIRGHRLLFPHSHAACLCGKCGVCKPSFVAAAGGRGLTTVMIGDGTSDRAAAEAADVVFAKAGLADWCAARDIEHVRFRGLADVQAGMPAAVRAARRRRFPG